MKLEENRLIITDPYIVNFIKDNADEDFLYACEDMLINIFKICEKNLKGDGSVDKYISHLNLFKTDLTKGIVTEILKQERSVDLSPLTGHLSEIKERIDLTKIVNNSTNNRDEAILNNIFHNQKGIENIVSKIEEIKLVRNTNRYKGESAEYDLRELLEQTFQMRDNYEIIETKTMPNNCDFVIKHSGYCDIRIECKNYKYDVGTSEVKKFENDLLGLDNHGIFISIGTKICGKGLIEVNMLHNNKLAIYLGCNNYDRDIIKDMVQLIYKLDTINSDNNFKITSESVIKIQTLLTDYIIKLKSIRTHMKTSLDLLSEISLSNIETLINGGNVKIDKTDSIKCDYCDKTFKKINGLTSHLKICKKK